MQEDLKNQLQNAIEIWRKKGQRVVEDILNDAKGEIRLRLSQKGIAERWTSIVNLVEEVVPEFAPPFATLLSSKMDSLAHWLGIKVKKWEPYRIEIFVSARDHLLEHKNWQSSSVLAMAETAARWLIEKHAPIGEFKIKVLGAEITHSSTNEFNGLHNCLARCELDSSEFEQCLAELIKAGSAEHSVPVMILGENDVLLSQVHFHFEFQWTALLK